MASETTHKRQHPTDQVPPDGGSTKTLPPPAEPEAPAPAEVAPLPGNPTKLVRRKGEWRSQ